MNKDRLIQWLCILIAIGALTGSAMLVPKINGQRRDLQLSFDFETGDRIPKEYALLAALGSLRGIAVDMAWYRAEMLKREGKFSESNTLAEFITTLQPRFPQVWSFHAWNLAYNISVETYTKEERWDWVSKGIRLLRDEGLVYNPKSVLLYKELGWILFHKVGKDSDDAHWYYKQQWAKEWHELMGEPRQGKVAGETNEAGWPVYQATRDFKMIADAAEVYFAADRQLNPITHYLQDHPKAQPILEALRDADIELNADGLRRVGKLSAMKSYLNDLGAYVQERGDRYDDKDKAIVALLTNESLKEPLEVLLAFWRAKALIEDYHMKPTIMYKLMQEIGPFDWRHPVSHAAYFDYLGVMMAGELRDNTKIDILNTDRGVIHATQLLTEKGNIIYDPNSGRLDLLPDPRFIHAYAVAFQQASQRASTTTWQGGENDSNFAQGHENFLIKATLSSYLYGDIEEAQKYYRDVRTRYGHTPYNQRTGRYLNTLSDFILAQLNQDWDQSKVVTAFVSGMVSNALVRGLANNRTDVFNRFTELAKQGYDRYQEKRAYSNTLTQRSRLGLPDTWAETFAFVYINVMRSPNLPILERSRIWRNSSLELQRQTYIHIRPPVREQAQRLGYDFDRFFAPPPGFVEPNIDAPSQNNDQTTTIERQ